MNLSEDQFRTELHEALSSSGRHLPAVDPVGIVATGGRVVRRRRIAVASATTAAAAVLAVALGTTLGGPTDDAVPGSPTTSSRVAVDGGATLTLPGTRVAGGIEATRFVVRIGPRAAAPTDSPSTIPAGDLAYYLRAADGSLQLMGGSSTDGLGRRSTLGYGGGDVVIGIVPDDATSVSLLPGHDGGTGGFAQDGPTRIPGTGYSAVAFRLNKVPAADETDFRPVWWRADGTPVTNDESGSRVDLASTQGTVTLWALPKAGLWGHRTAGGSSMTALSTMFAAGPIADLDDTSDYVRDETKTPATVRAHLIHTYVIRGLVRDVRATYAPGRDTGAAPVVAAWPELGVTAVLAEADLAEQPETTPFHPIVTRLAWTNADGSAGSADVPAAGAR